MSGKTSPSASADYKDDFVPSLGTLSGNAVSTAIAREATTRNRPALANPFSRYYPYINAGVTLLWGRLLGRKFPWYINYFLTSRCNLSCPYCYVTLNQDPALDPTLDQVKSTVDELYQLGTRYICLLGGEPLLRKDLDQIVDHIIGKQMLVAINTNGTIRKRHTESLKRMNRVVVSLVGDRESHDKDRGKGSYDKAIETIRWFREIGVRGLAFQTTISASTINSWEHVLNIAKEHGCTVLFTEIACRPGEYSEDADVPRDELRRMWERIRELKKQGAPVENSFLALDNLIKYGEHISPFEAWGQDGAAIPEPLQPFSRRFPCTMGNHNAFLDYDGSLYPCASLFGSEDASNIHEQGVSGAYRKMSTADRCKCCRVMINYQTTYLFSSFDLRTVFNIARHAFRNYGH